MGLFSAIERLAELLREIGDLQRKPDSQRVEFLRRLEPRSVFTPDGRVIPVVQRGSCQLWEEKGWKLSNGVLLGYYRGRRRAFKGKIEKPFKSPELFIFEPPSEILRDRHGACFKERERNLYWIHFSPSPEDVNAGILRVEHCLLEQGI